MTHKPLKNPSASILERLRNHAKAHRNDFQRILTGYAIERLLFRLRGIKYILRRRHALRDLAGTGLPANG